jgi:hypothetical protein
LSCSKPGFHLLGCECKGNCPQGRCGLKCCLSSINGPIAGIQYQEERRRQKHKASSSSLQPADESSGRVIGRKIAAAAADPHCQVAEPNVDPDDELDRAPLSSLVNVNSTTPSIADPGRSKLLSDSIHVTFHPQSPPAAITTQSTALPPSAAPLHSHLLSLLPDLTHLPALLNVLGDGRCSVASALLALGIIADEHNNRLSKDTIDQVRRALGETMRTVWTEEQWIQLVPIELRGAHISLGKNGPAGDQSSYDSYYNLLTSSPPWTWLDHCVFYLIARHYEVGVFIVCIRTTDNRGQVPEVSCRHIGPDYDRQIIIVHSMQGSSGHYQCVQYDGLRVFPIGHELLVRVIDLGITHPPQAAVEDDTEKLRYLTTHRSKERTAPSSPISSAQPRFSVCKTGSRSLTGTSSPAPVPNFPKPSPARRKPPRHKQGTPRTSSTPSARTSSRSPARPKQSQRPHLNLSSVPKPSPARRQPPRNKQGTSRTSSTPSVRTSSTTLVRQKQSQQPHPNLPSVAEIAAHGDLYDFISFSNVPQWAGMCSTVFNAYRVASQDGNRQRQTQAIVDLMMLPQKVLTKLGRGGTGAGKRLVRTVKARCRDAGQQLRRRYDCTDPVDHNVQLTVETAPLVQSANRARERAELVDTDVMMSDDEESSTCMQPEVSSVHSNDTTVAVESHAVSAASYASTSSDSSSNEDDCITSSSDDDGVGSGPIARAFRTMTGYPHDTDEQAVYRAQHLVNTGHTKRASQTLHSTSTMADLTQQSVREAMQLLHPPLPAGSILPTLPADADQIILEDDDEMKRIILSSNNGSASGPSGWGGNMLSSLVESSICRGGIIILLKDIINGNITDQARQYLLASRLVGLNKPDAGARPIAIGEVFYRLAGVIAVRKITAAAAELLVPHQYGIGVPSGAERIVHSMQYSLTDKAAKRAVLKVDISNAFNSCDRAAMLRKLYATPQLAPLYRIADFGYSAPSQLLLQRCNGLSIQSTNGVRQGDPLACLLFCIYMKDVYEAVASRANVVLYAYVDDLHIVGAPAEVMKALTALQTLLPTVSLRCNTAKSHFAYFHQEAAPLNAAILHTLAQQDITVHDNWMEVMGAVIGRDAKAVQAGVASITSQSGNDAFFRRLQSPLLSVQSAMLLLRQCAVPQMNYLLRCMPPSCIAEQADEFDNVVLTSAYDKLEVWRGERNADTDRLLRMRLRDGGFGLTSSVYTSPAAYIASVASARETTIFAPYGKADHPLPSDTLLHSWLADSMRLVTEATPDSASILPPSASSFFSFYTAAKSSLSSTLQRKLSLLANQHRFDASLTAAKQMRKQDGGAALAHAKAISAPLASAWKRTAPTHPLLKLRDTQFRIGARLNLGLPPFSDMRELPDSCPLCRRVDAISKDAWHFLYCSTQMPLEINTRHNAVVDALYYAVLIMGGQAVREPKGMHREDGRRPDLQVVFPGKHILTDVVISHPLSAGRLDIACGGRATAVAHAAQQKKKRKYEETAARHEAKLLIFSVETCGGMAPDAMTMLDEISRAGQEHLSLWSHQQIVQHMLCSVAIAIQKGNAMAVLGAYSTAIVRGSAAQEHSVE